MGAAGSNGYQLGHRPVSSGFARYPSDDVSNAEGKHCYHFAKWLWKVWAPTAQRATMVTSSHRARMRRSPGGSATRSVRADDPRAEPKALSWHAATLARHFRIIIVAYHVHMNRARLAELATL
jgi:hypothetical protein